MLEGEQWCKKTVALNLSVYINFKCWIPILGYAKLLFRISGGLVWYIYSYEKIRTMAYQMNKSCWILVFFLVLETSMGGFRHCWDTRLSSVDWTYLQFSCSWGPYIAICNRHFDRCSRLASRSIQVCKWISHAFNFKIIFFVGLNIVKWSATFL